MDVAATYLLAPKFDSLGIVCFSSCGSTDAHSTLTALKSLPRGRPGPQRTARRARRRQRRGSLGRGARFQNSPADAPRCPAAAAAAARGRLTHSGARRAAARPPTTGDAGAPNICRQSGRALTAPRRARAAAAAARGRPTHTLPRGGRARALPQLGRGAPRNSRNGRRNISPPKGRALICLRRRSDRKDDPTKERGDAPRALRDGGRTGRKPCSELQADDAADSVAVC